MLQKLKTTRSHPICKNGYFLKLLIVAGATSSYLISIYRWLGFGGRSVPHARREPRISSKGMAQLGQAS